MIYVFVGIGVCLAAMGLGFLSENKRDSHAA